MKDSASTYQEYAKTLPDNKLGIKSYSEALSKDMPFHKFSVYTEEEKIDEEE
jgi:hypothetical protein